MSVKQLTARLEKVKARIESRRSELATLVGQQKDLRAQLTEAKKAEKAKASKSK